MILCRLLWPKTFVSIKAFRYALKVSKSQKHFFLKHHCPKNEQNIWQNSALASKGRILSNVLFVFGAMQFQEKMLLKFTNLYMIPRRIYT